MSTNRRLLTKFRLTPGTLSPGELKALKVFLTQFLELFSAYSEHKDSTGIAKNEILSDIASVEWYIRRREGGEGEEEEAHICPECNGSGEGQWDGARCHYCKGRGTLGGTLV